MTNNQEKNPNQKTEADPQMIQIGLAHKDCFLNLPTNMLIDFRERGKKGERERERNINMRQKHQPVASGTHPDRDQTCNLDMCPAQESNPPPFVLWTDAPTNWATGQGSTQGLLITMINMLKKIKGKMSKIIFKVKTFDRELES